MCIPESELTDAAYEAVHEAVLKKAKQLVQMQHEIDLKRTAETARHSALTDVLDALEGHTEAMDIVNGMFPE